MAQACNCKCNGCGFNSLYSLYSEALNISHYGNILVTSAAKNGRKVGNSRRKVSADDSAIAGYSVR